MCWGILLMNNMVSLKCWKAVAPWPNPNENYSLGTLVNNNESFCDCLLFGGLIKFRLFIVQFGAHKS